MSLSSMIQSSTYSYNLIENKYFQQFKNKVLNDDIKKDDDCHFKIKKITIEDIVYYMVNYKKEFINKENINELGLFRSLVFDENCNLLCFSPNKTDYKDKFFENVNTDDLIIEPLIEGTMINLFYDSRVDKWLISTKSTIGGNVSYFKNTNNEKSKTFKEMFEDATGNDKSKFVENLSKNNVYSFVLQHPDNRIVTYFSVPNLILVEKYCIQDNKIEYISPPSENLIKFNNEFDINIGPYSQNQFPPNVMGCILKNHKNNTRVKYRNTTFEYIKKLRGNQCKLEYTYLQLRKNGRLKEYLQWYPEHSNEMIQYKDKLHNFTNSLYNNYISCYIKKVKPLKEYPYEFKNHMFNLHEIYKDFKKQEGKSIQYIDVINYVNNLHESKLMYSLNYNFRNKKLD